MHNKLIISLIVPIVEIMISDIEKYNENLQHLRYKEI